MTPISYFLREEIFFDSLSSIQSNKLPPISTICGWAEDITDFFCTRMEQLRTYPSKFELIQEAIQQIPKEGDLNALNVIDVLKIFNHTIYKYRKVFDPIPLVSCVQELEKLEQKIEDHALKKLWNALWTDALPVDAIDPQLQTIAQKREWLEDKRNQPLLDAVTGLDLVNCGMVCLPREIFKLRNLKKLNLSKNLIEVLPESIKVWEKLESLNLFHNKLRYLPDNGIKHLVELRDLDVRDNQLTEVPRSISHCNKLTELDLRGNDLKKVPLEIDKCVFLRAPKLSFRKVTY